MSGKKKNTRIKQTKTSWQKAVEDGPIEIQYFSWSDNLPEVLHISMALAAHDYQTVKMDFHRIGNYVNTKHPRLKSRFHFNLSHTIKLIKKDKTILEEIFKTCFKSAFELLLGLYEGIFKIAFKLESEPEIEQLFVGYGQILDGRSDISILCKFMMLQYEQIERLYPFGMYKLNSQEEILLPENVSIVMCCFQLSIGQSKYIDLSLCRKIWMFNYLNTPFMTRPDDGSEDNNRYNEYNIEKLANEFNDLFQKFKEIRLIVAYPRTVGEINSGFAARIGNLTLDLVELVKTNKGEIAELVFRTILETFILGSWLIKKHDGALYQRFRDYSTGRQKFMGEKVINTISDEAAKEKIAKMISSTIHEAGVREVDVAAERGDIFGINTAKMAEEVWGPDSPQYFLYKRSSEVTHGNWKVIAKYHLAKSRNPMHNGLYGYNENPVHSAGLTPVFLALGFATHFLLTIIEDIDSEQLWEIKKKLIDFHKSIKEANLEYTKKYV